MVDSNLYHLIENKKKYIIVLLYMIFFFSIRNIEAKKNQITEYMPNTFDITKLSHAKLSLKSKIKYLSHKL